MTFKETYAGAEYQIRLKAPILRAIILIILALMVPLAVNAVLSGNAAALGATAVMFLVLAASFVLLARGRYDRASLIVTYSFVVILIANGMMEMYSHEAAFAGAANYAAIIFVLSLVFAPTLRHNIIQASLFFLYFLLKIAIPVATGMYTENGVTLTQQILVPLVTVPVLCALTVLFRRIFDTVLSDALENMRATEEQARRLSVLVSDSSAHLAEARGMKEHAEQTASAVVQIEGNVGSISAQFTALGERYAASDEALGGIAAKAKGLEELAGEQSANITETGAAMEEMVASIKSVSGVIRSKKESVAALRVTADDGAGVIKDTLESFETVTGHIDAIKEMISIIKSISSRTNLLAMNAAIEAAHAGDAGRGFAVVADEVRKLAESSSANAGHIQETLNELIGSIQSTGTNLTNSGESFAQIREEVRRVGEAMDEITSSIGELTSGSDEVLRATSQLNDLTASLNDAVASVNRDQGTAVENVKGLGDFIVSLKGSMEEIGFGTRSIRDEMQRLSQMSSRLNAFTEDLAAKLASGSS